MFSYEEESDHVLRMIMQKCAQQFTAAVSWSIRFLMETTYGYAI